MNCIVIIMLIIIKKHYIYQNSNKVLVYSFCCDYVFTINVKITIKYIKYKKWGQKI